MPKLRGVIGGDSYLLAGSYCSAHLLVPFLYSRSARKCQWEYLIYPEFVNLLYWA